MSDLIAITFDTRDQAQAARTDFARLGREHVVDLADSVIAYKQDGKVKLDQTVNLAAAGAASGGFWGLLLGLIFSIPVGGTLLPVFTAVFGAGFGALSGKLSDYGIDDDMMKELSSDLEAGKATLFILVRKATTDRVLEALASHRGKVLRTSLSAELEAKLAKVLDGGEPQALAS